VDNQLCRFGHHPDAAIDFCIEVEEIEAIAACARLGLTGFGHEQDRETLDSRIERAMDFRVGGDAGAVSAKAALRAIATARGFKVTGEHGYAGQPLQRMLSARKDAGHE